MTPETPAQKAGRLAGWLGGIGVALLFVALRWNSFDAPLIRDEGEYAYSARLLVLGLAPYEHAFIQKPPMVVYSYALSSFLMPHIFWAPRVLAYAFAALATLLLGYLARLDFGKGFALPAMWLVTPMILLPGLGQFAANTEMFLLLPLLATVAVYRRSRQHGDPPVSWLAAGFLGVTTLLYKYTTLPVLAFVFAAWSVELWRGHKNVSRLGRCWLLGLAGGLLAAAVWLGFFLIHDGGAGIWECTVRFNRYYTASGNFGLGALESQFGDFLEYWWILFLLPWAALIQPGSRPWFWFGMLASALVATSASYYGHYYIVLMPFWAMLTTAGIARLEDGVARGLGRPAPLVRLLFTALVVIILLHPDLRWMTCSREQFAEKKMALWSPFLESATVARRIDELSSPDDPVFIAGSEPQILCYAQRTSPSRFITMYSLMIPSPLARGYQQEAIRDLQAHPPALVVMAPANASWLVEDASPKDFLTFLNPWLEQQYALVGGYVRTGDTGRWVEPLTGETQGAPSLMLYKLKKHTGFQ
jgi:hypothetical protein